VLVVNVVLTHRRSDDGGRLLLIINRGPCVDELERIINPIVSPAMIGRAEGTTGRGRPDLIDKPQIFLFRRRYEGRCGSRRPQDAGHLALVRH
jgi:hypothetical protein